MNATKPSLLILHGALGSKAQLKALAERLSEEFDVYVFDLPGHGGTTVPHIFSISDFASYTLSWITKNSLSRPYVFGYSMGGYIALKLAMDHPEVVSRIITLGTKFLWNPESAEKEVRMMNPDLIEQKLPEFASTLQERHHPQDWKRIMRITGDMMLRMGQGEALRDDDFKRVSVPVKVCIGTEDHMVTLEESRHTAGLLPQGRLEVIEGFRHPIERIDYGRMASICHDFFLTSGPINP